MITKPTKHWGVWDWALRPIAFMLLVLAFIYIGESRAESCLTKDAILESGIENFEGVTRAAVLDQNQTDELIEFSKLKVKKHPFITEGLTGAVAFRNNQGQSSVFFTGGPDHQCRNWRNFYGPQELTDFITNLGATWVDIGESI